MTTTSECPKLRKRQQERLKEGVIRVLAGIVVRSGGGPLPFTPVRRIRDRLWEMGYQEPTISLSLFSVLLRGAVVQLIGEGMLEQHRHKLTRRGRFSKRWSVRLVNSFDVPLPKAPPPAAKPKPIPVAHAEDSLASAGLIPFLARGISGMLRAMWKSSGRKPSPTRNQQCDSPGPDSPSSTT